MQTKRVSSEEIKQNYTQITGEEAVIRLFANEEVFGAERQFSWKIIDGLLYARDYREESDTGFEYSELRFNTLLTEMYRNDWYIAPFDARKEMLARPGEWVAKYERTAGWLYFGLDLNEMVVVGSFNINDAVEFNATDEVPSARSINEAIPLDAADLAKLTALRDIEKGVDANG